jgi:uncharacterized membrane protein
MTAMNFEIPLDRIDAIVRRVRYRQLARQVLLSFFAVMSLGSLAFSLHQLLKRDVAPLIVLPGLVICVVGLVVLARLWAALRDERRGYAGLAEPSRRAVGHARDATRKALRETRRAIVIVIGVFAPLLTFAIAQLWLSGKIEPVNALQLAGFTLLVTAVVVTVKMQRIRRQFEPRLRELDALERQFDE